MSFSDVQAQETVIHKKALLGGKIIHFYREAPVTSLDSGWRFISDADDDASLNQGVGVMKATLQRVSFAFPAIKEMYDAPVGSLYKVVGTEIINMTE